MAFLPTVLESSSYIEKAAKRYFQDDVPNEEKFASKHERPPMNDDDCTWDYYRAQCKWPNYCMLSPSMLPLSVCVCVCCVMLCCSVPSIIAVGEYNYHFGDLHLSQSCRLKTLVSAELGEYYGSAYPEICKNVKKDAEGGNKFKEREAGGWGGGRENELYILELN